MGLSGSTSHPKECVLRIFIALKIPSSWPGSNPRTLGPLASTLTTTPPRQLMHMITGIFPVKIGLYAMRTLTNCISSQCCVAAHHLSSMVLSGRSSYRSLIQYPILYFEWSLVISCAAPSFYCSSNGVRIAWLLCLGSWKSVWAHQQTEVHRTTGVFWYDCVLCYSDLHISQSLSKHACFVYNSHAKGGETN
jgi:hypothetical protein